MKEIKDIILEGGKIYDGFVVENAEHLKITCTDSSPAVVKGGICLHNCNQIEISGVILRGKGWNTDSGKGLAIEQCEQIKVRNVEVSGFAETGIEIKDSKDVLIEGCFAYRNGFCGICTSLDQNYNERITIRHCKAYDNGGTHTIRDNHSGSGIAIFHTKDALVEYCEAAGNGWAQRQKNINGPVGIWCACDVDGVVFRKCISRHNRTQPGGVDGDGFDIDGGVKNGLMEDNYSYENEGSGYLFCEYGSGIFFENNSMRRCVSIGDATRVTHQGAVQYYGPDGIPMSDSHSAKCLLIPADEHACVVNHELGDQCTDMTLKDSVLIPSEKPAITDENSRRAEVKNNKILRDISVRNKIMKSVIRLTEPRLLDGAPVFRHLEDGTLASYLEEEEKPELFKPEPAADFSEEKLKICYQLNGRDFEGSRLKVRNTGDAALVYDSVGPCYALQMTGDSRLEFEYPSWSGKERHLAVLEARVENPETKAWMFVAADGKIVDAVSVGGTVGKYMTIILPLPEIKIVPTIGVLTHGNEGKVYLKEIKLYEVVTETDYCKTTEPSTFGDVQTQDGVFVLHGRGSRLAERQYRFGQVTVSADTDHEGGQLYVRDMDGELQHMTLKKGRSELTFTAKGYMEYGIVNENNSTLKVELNCRS